MADRVVDPALKWRPFGPPYARITAMAFDQTRQILYAGSAEGLYSVASTAEEWEKVRSFSHSDDMTSLVLSPRDGRLYALFESRGVIMSPDGGIHWKVLGSGIGDTRWVDALAVDPSDPRVLYLTSDNGVFKSTDAGESWALSKTGLPDYPDVVDLVIDPTSPSIIYCAARDGIYKSTDGGARWLPSSSGLPDGVEAQDLDIHPSSPATLYLACGAAGVYRSADAGLSWQSSSTGIAEDTDAWEIVQAPSIPTTLYAMGHPYPSLYRSSDGGTTWSRLRPLRRTSFAYLRSIVVDPVDPESVYLGRDSGIDMSRDGGQTWTRLDRGLSGMGAWAAAVDPLGSATVYAATRQGLEKTSDAGMTWRVLKYGWNGRVVVDPRNPETIYWTGQDMGLSKSTDGGATWQRLGLKYPHWGTVWFVVNGRSGTDTLYAGGTFEISEYDWAEGLFRSEDGGATWTWLGTAPYGVRSLVTDRAGVIYAGGIGRWPVAMSADGGDTWQIISTGIGHTPVTCLAVVSSSATLYAGTRRRGIFRSRDAGAHWERVLPATISGVVTSIVTDPRGDGIVYASTRTGGVLRSVDGASSWQPINDGLLESDINSLAIDPQRPDVLYACSDRSGVFILEGLDD